MPIATPNQPLPCRAHATATNPCPTPTSTPPHLQDKTRVNMNDGINKLTREKHEAIQELDERDEIEKEGFQVAPSQSYYRPQSYPCKNQDCVSIPDFGGGIPLA